MTFQAGVFSHKKCITVFYVLEVCNPLILPFLLSCLTGLVGKRVFEFKWVMCCPGICHQPKFLSVAQIIPKTGECNTVMTNAFFVL